MVELYILTSQITDEGVCDNFTFGSKQLLAGASNGKEVSKGRAKD